MKKNLYDIMDELTPRELDILLDGTFDIDDAANADIDAIRVKTLNKAGLSEYTVRKTKRSWNRAAILAACLLLTFSAGACAYADVKEYNEAMEFFAENSLSVDGLTRFDIKKIYRDITTESFTYAKTADVLETSLSTGAVDGWEIPQDEPTPEDIEALWNRKNFNGVYWVANADFTGRIHYRYDSEFREDDKLGFEVFDHSIFEKYSGHDLLWRVIFTDFIPNRYFPIDSGVLVCGCTYRWSSEQDSPAWLAKISDDGTLLWARQLEHGFHWETVNAVVENSDGGYAVFSRGELDAFCLSQWSADGEELSLTALAFGVANAARFGDGYLVNGSFFIGSADMQLALLDRDGNLTDSFTYESADSLYYIQDMTEFAGNIYLSAYACPKVSGDASAGGRYDIAPVLNYLFDNGIRDISGEELTPLVRANYTALLLVCDPDGGEPMAFYSVSGSLGGKLAVSEDGMLQWDVESIAATFFSPATSSFTIGGTCHVYRYTFDGNGTLLLQEKTSESAGFYR